MSTVAIVACIVLGCIAISEARDCIDYLGKPVASGQSYYDGCNTCQCGVNGMPTICTLRYCLFYERGRITGRPVGRV
ncbi:hypothetical protein DPMN_109109 [Dreissena polymorpha]|uniref:Pacifastin domain-containing protein n=1 Tax=Dreissena polymorpha TaxID=45954 RepID=A0A9D4K9P6_DREPO|nr:hypothetical protein DPMN_109109 [Dreissena polymorpha]